MRKKHYSRLSEDYEAILCKEEPSEAEIRSIKDSNIVKYRTKTIKSGNVLECEVYPIWRTHTSSNRAKKEKPSREAQQRINQRNAVKNVVRLINTNFTDSDIWGTFTYETKKLPKTIEEAQKEMAKFIRRLKYYAERHGYAELKYIYVTEFENDEEKGKHRVHHHIVMNFPDRDVAETLWRNGARRQTRRLQADESGYEGLARYIMKDPRGLKKYVCSKNLKKPIITIADSKFTKGKVFALVKSKANAPDVFEQMYKGYEMIGYSVKTSDYVSGAYIYVKMRTERKRGG